MRRLKTNMTILLAASLLLLAVPASAGWEEGVAAYKSGNYTTAAKEFQAVVDEKDDWAGGHFMLGLSLQKLKRNEDALKHLRKAYDLNPNDISYKMALAKSYLDTGAYSSASQVLDSVQVSSLPKAQQASYHQMQAVALEKSGRSGEALNALEKLAREKPNDADVQFRYGLAAFNAGQSSAATTAIEKAIRLDGDDVKKRDAYVKMMIRNARTTSGSQKKAVYAKALPHAQAVASKQATYDNLLTLGEVQLGAQQYSAAVGSFNQAAAKNENAWLAHYYAGQALTSLDRFQDAENKLRRALQCNGVNEKAVWSQMGYVYEKLKRYPQAKEAYVKAGNQAGVSRVEENERIAAENLSIEEENRRIQEMESERRRLEEELKELPGGRPPR